MSGEQEKRTAKALAGLADGSITVALTAPDTWRVTNGDHEPHIVVRVSQSWACDCPDFAHYCRDRGLRCKHAEAARLTPPTKPLAGAQKEKQMEQPNNFCGWTKLYHPNGPQVTLPVPADGAVIAPEAAKAAFDSITALLSAGWLVNAPGLEDGEQRDDIGFVVKRVKVNDDGSETPVVDLYPPRANFRILGVYLNTPDDVKAFEQACGVSLGKLPLYEGDNAIERGKGPKTDKYVYALPRPAKVVFKHNPRWEGAEDKSHPKRLFVRWDAAAVPASANAAPTQPPAGQPANGNGASAAPASAPAPTGGHVAADAVSIDAELGVALSFVMPEGKTTKGKKLGALDDATLRLIAGEQYQPATPEGKQAKKYAALLLQHAPSKV